MVIMLQREAGEGSGKSNFSVLKSVPENQICIFDVAIPLARLKSDRLQLLLVVLVSVWCSLIHM